MYRKSSDLEPNIENRIGQIKDELHLATGIAYFLHLENDPRLPMLSVPKRTLGHGIQMQDQDIKALANAREKLEDFYFSTTDHEIRTKISMMLGWKAIDRLSNELLRGEYLKTSQLTKVYHRSELAEARVKAGQELGYSKMRIWAHENPVKTIMTEAAVVAVIDILLIQYLSR